MRSIPLREIGPLLRVTFRYWYHDRAPRLGAALAYYVALSLAPMLVIMVAIAGFAFNPQTVQGGLNWQIQNMVGPDVSQLIQTIVAGAHRSRHGVAATIVGVLTLFFGATAAVTELRDSLNTIWQVPLDPTISHVRSMYNILRDRILSLSIVLTAGLYLLASLALNPLVSAISEWLNPIAAPSRYVGEATEWLVSFLVVTALFALIFKMMPSVTLEWGDVAIGAAGTGILFAAGKAVLGLYLSRAGFTNTYGAAGSIVVLLVWVYYSSQVLFFGAEFTRAYTDRFGSRSRP